MELPVLSDAGSHIGVADLFQLKSVTEENKEEGL